MDMKHCYPWQPDRHTYRCSDRKQPAVTASFGYGQTSASAQGPEEEVGHDMTKRNLMLSPGVLDRLSLEVERIQSGGVLADPGRPVLTHIGDLVSTWRLQHSLTRAQTAAMVDISPEQLLFMENGMALTGDISADQLLRLLQLCAGSEQEPELKMWVYAYLVQVDCEQRNSDQVDLQNPCS